MEAGIRLLKLRLSGTILLLVICVFSCLRLYDITADFPPGITQSGSLYTDEGVHSTAATSHVIHGDWYTLSAHNMTVNMPMGQIITGFVWKLFGMSISAARYTLAVCGIVLIGLAYPLLRRFMPRQSVIYVVAFLSTSPFLFAYSRIALMDLMMTVFAVLALVIGSSRWQVRRELVIVVATVILWVASLVKSSGVFAVPLLAFVVGLHESNLKKRFLWAVECAVVFGMLYGVYNLIIWRLYPLDCAYNFELLVGCRIPIGYDTYLLNPITIVRFIYRLDAIAVITTLALMIFLAVRSAAFRLDTAVHISLIWIASFVMLKMATIYHPPRFYVPLLIPMFVLLVRSVDHLAEMYPHRITRALKVVFLAGLIAFNSVTIISSMNNRKHSFIEMIHGIEKAISDTGVKPSETTLISVFAHTVSMETGIPAISTSTGTRSFTQRIEGVESAFYAPIGDRPHIEKQLRSMYRFRQIGRWDVFGNYLTGKPIRLYQIQRDSVSTARDM
jgi:hypothetical protein